MEIDHKGDVKKYAPAATDAHIAMKSKDAQMVSCSSKDELDRVRDSWCKKKLGLTNPDAELDKAIQEVCAKMKGDKSKSRIAFYYLLADKYGKLSAL
jgi:Protein of unknown function (DUF2853)